MRHESAETARNRIRIADTLDLHHEVLGNADSIFNIHASRSAHQRVLRDAVVVDPPVDWRVETELSLGNRLLRLHADAGPLDVRYVGGLAYERIAFLAASRAPA
ncbi:MAG: hypothetical protein M3R40_02070 [Pseudomonadota bacterium]|nr:hypothetical protein [Pseudomonadota bacterium]